MALQNGFDESTEWLMALERGFDGSTDYRMALYGFREWLRWVYRMALWL